MVVDLFPVGEGFFTSTIELEEFFDAVSNGLGGEADAESFGFAELLEEGICFRPH